MMRRQMRVRRSVRRCDCCLQHGDCRLLESWWPAAGLAAVCATLQVGYVAAQQWSGIATATAVSSWQTAGGLGWQGGTLARIGGDSPGRVCGGPDRPGRRLWQVRVPSFVTRPRPEGRGHGGPGGANLNARARRRYELTPRRQRPRPSEAALAVAVAVRSHSKLDDRRSEAACDERFKLNECTRTTSTR